MDIKYKLRIADRLLARKLAGKGAVLIEGPKWCGKTTTARQLAKSLLDCLKGQVLRGLTLLAQVDKVRRIGINCFLPP